MSDLSGQLTSAILAEDPDAFGHVSVTRGKGTFMVNGELRTILEDPAAFIQDWFKSRGERAFVSLDTKKKGLAVTEQGVATTSSHDSSEELDEVRVLFFGEVPLGKIKATGKYKRMNFDTVEKVRSAVDVLGFIAPLVLDADYNVIDGELRLEVALRSGLKKVPAVVINDSGAKAAMLRLVLNRSSEFQKWIYSDVDAYVDEWPQLQPVLEPLGFFSNNILPTSFFGNTVLEYRIDEYNDQMKEYSQDLGLVAWAAMQREKNLAAEEAKQKLKKAKKPSTSGMQSLFDMAPPKPEDYVETYDAPAEVRKHVVSSQELAGTITDAYDKKRKAEMEAQGRAWQGTRRTSKKKASDRRAEAEAVALGFDDEDLGVELDDSVDEDA